MPFDLIVSEVTESALVEKLSTEGVIKAGESGWFASEGFVVSPIGPDKGKFSVLVGIDDRKLPATEVTRIELALAPLKVAGPPTRVWAGPKELTKPYWELTESEKQSLFSDKVERVDVLQPVEELTKEQLQ